MLNYLQSNTFFPALVLGFVLSITAVQTTGCVGAPFSQTALDNVKMVAQKLPALMENATKPYAGHATEADGLLASIAQAQQFAGGLKRNKDVAEQWRLLSEDMVKPFVKRWKEQGPLNINVIKPAVEQVRSALAAMERAEAGKRRSK